MSTKEPDRLSTAPMLAGHLAGFEILAFPGMDRHPHCPALRPPQPSRMINATEQSILIWIKGESADARSVLRSTCSLTSHTPAPELAGMHLASFQEGNRRPRHKPTQSVLVLGRSKDSSESRLPHSEFGLYLGMQRCPTPCS
jgi:hypothetical protein